MLQNTAAEQNITNKQHRQGLRVVLLLSFLKLFKLVQLFFKVMQSKIERENPANSGTKKHLSDFELL